MSKHIQTILAIARAHLMTVQHLLDEVVDKEVHVHHHVHISGEGVNVETNDNEECASCTETQCTNNPVNTEAPATTVNVETAGNADVKVEVTPKAEADVPRGRDGRPLVGAALAAYHRRQAELAESENVTVAVEESGSQASGQQASTTQATEVINVAAAIDPILVDERYNLHKLSTLASKTGIDASVILAYVQSNDSKYVVKRKRFDASIKLVGLVDKAGVAAQLSSHQAAPAEAAPAEAAPQVEEAQAETPVVDEFEQDLDALLSGEFDLRKVSTLAEKLGSTEADILEFAQGKSDKYVVKSKRNDSSVKLVGLVERQ